MPAYVIVEIEINNPIQFEEYKKLTPASLAAYEGRFIVRGGTTFCLEGDWNPERMVVTEFPSVERAQEWWNSPEYKKAKELRQGAAKTKMIIVEGI